MILIADGGSTKTHWRLISDDGRSSNFYSEGYNPYFVDEEYIVKSITQVFADVSYLEIQKLFFYGAGVHTEEKGSILKNAFSSFFGAKEVNVEHDLLAACRALLGNEAGFAAILGTGTNTCVYDGREISYHIDSAAYILGDEGSGCHIGKSFLLSFLRDTLSPDVKSRFEKEYRLSSEQILDFIYTKPLANRFCAGFSEFVYKNLYDPRLRTLVFKCFSDFFENLVCLYPEYQNYKLNAVGSVAYHFRPILEECAARFNMKIGRIEKSPIDALVAYHTQVL